MPLKPADVTVDEPKILDPGWFSAVPFGESEDKTYGEWMQKMSELEVQNEH